jgi:phosphoribosylglycinamide formyltransferase-1
MKKKIAVLASGGGSNAEELIRHFEHAPNGEISLVVSNKSDAYVLTRAKQHGIPSYIHSKEDLENGGLLSVLKANQIDFVILAGYLKKIPKDVIQHFNKKIVNIHPALLPSYGGKGMYGMNVHRAVAENKETTSGITIHYVNENYDEGSIIKQVTCSIDPNESPESIQKKVLKLEHEFFAKTIAEII